MTNWVLLQAKRNKEDFLLGELCTRGMECYCPKIQVRTINPRARKVRPLFPGYLFVHLETDNMGTAELRWLPGVTGWVRFGEQLASVPDSIIIGIRRKVDQLNANGGEAVSRPIKHNESVEIIGGPFTGYEAIFDTYLSGNERVRVLLQMIKSRQIPLELHAGQLKIINRGKLQTR